MQSDDDIMILRGDTIMIYYDNITTSGENIMTQDDIVKTSDDNGMIWDDTVMTSDENTVQISIMHHAPRMPYCSTLIILSQHKAICSPYIYSNHLQSAYL